MARRAGPHHRSTFKQVPAHDLPEFETALLKPFFGTDLAELATLAGEPIENSGTDSDAKPSSRAGPGAGVRRVSMERLASTASTTAHPARAKPTLMQLLA